MPDREGSPGRRSAPADAAELASLGLRRLSESLTPAERAAFVLHDLMGLSNPQAASLLGRSPVSTQRLVAAARRRLTAVGPPPGSQPVTPQSRAVSQPKRTAIRPVRNLK